jgi:hypothetical protein
MPKKTKKENHEQIEVFLNNSLRDFTTHVSGLDKTLFALFVMQKISEIDSNKVRTFIQTKGKDIKEKKKILKFKLQNKDISVFNKLREEEERSKIAVKVLPRSLMVSMVSQFDCLITILIKRILKKYEGAISHEKTLTITEIKNLKNKDDIIDFLIEKEISSLGYDNHISHIEWIETKTGVKIMEYIKDEVPILIELTERRNLFVHNDGKVDSKYLNNCKKGKVVFNRIYKKGEDLSVGPKYFKDCYNCLYSISAKIVYLLSEKLSPKDNKDQLNEFFNNEICIKLIQNKNYVLSRNILKFILDNFKGVTTEAFTKVFVINYALVNKLDGNDNEARNIIKKEDWTACNNDLKLAVSIINGDFEETFDLMEKIGKHGDIITMENYRNDPIFIPIRKMDRFRDLYKKIYNEDYLSLEQEISPNKGIVQKEVTKK